MRCPTLSGSLSRTAAIVIPCSAKIGELAIALPEATGADEGDVVLTLRAQDLSDLVEERVGAVPDAALAELPERREVAADLRRVDVRVLGDLLRRDPVLAHLPRLSEHLQVPAQARCDTDGQAFGHDIPRSCVRDKVSRFCHRLSRRRGRTVRREPRAAAERVGVDEVRERPLAVDLDDREQLPVARLELGVAADVDDLQLEVLLRLDAAHDLESARAEPAVRRVVERDATPYG